MWIKAFTLVENLNYEKRIEWEMEKISNFINKPIYFATDDVNVIWDLKFQIKLIIKKS